METFIIAVLLLGAILAVWVLASQAALRLGHTLRFRHHNTHLSSHPTISKE